MVPSSNDSSSESRGSSSSTSGTSSSLSGGNATGSGRNKVALKPGHSLMDWIRKSAKEKDTLSGTNGRILEVTREELSKHNKVDDCWLVVHGKVYNVTPYLDFHPGGVDEMMRGAGTDATQLFNEVHKWVNFRSMLKNCFVGDFCPHLSLSDLTLNNSDDKKDAHEDDGTQHDPSGDDDLMDQVD